MEKITGKLYHEITNCTSLPVKPRIEFEIEEIVEILETIGYQVRIQTGPAKVTFRQWECPGEYTDEIREVPNHRRIVAHRPGEPIPVRVDESGVYDFMAVFHREMRNRFKMLITSFGKI